jgi:hypothetical protein
MATSLEDKLDGLDHDHRATSEIRAAELIAAEMARALAPAGRCPAAPGALMAWLRP